MEKFIKNWWPLLLIAGWWLWKKNKTKNVHYNANSEEGDLRKFIGKNVVFKFAPGAFPITGVGGMVTGYGIRLQGTDHMNSVDYLRDGDVRKIYGIQSYETYYGPDGGPLDMSKFGISQKIMFSGVSTDADFISVGDGAIGTKLILTELSEPV